LAYAVGDSSNALTDVFLLGYNRLLVKIIDYSYILPSIAAAVISGIFLAGSSINHLGALRDSILLTSLIALLIPLDGLWQKTGCNWFDADRPARFTQQLLPRLSVSGLETGLRCFLHRGDEPAHKN
jgi:hypothetical protein